VVLAPVLLAAAICSAPEPKQGSAQSYTITAVSGPSWLNHLGLSRRRSALGQMGDVGVRPKSASSPAWGKSSFPEALDRPMTLSGADLYRLNCQSCHNVEGVGTPPEILSLIDPVRATSPELLKAKMEERGLPVDKAQIASMTSQAEAGLRKRLEKGGEKMPAFAHLEGAEIEALLGYLRALAGVPGADKPLTVTEPAARVGEHLVKGTCAICHDSVGPGRDAIANNPGLIPSLASFLEQNAVASVVQKGRQGLPAPGMPGKRGEMPIFSYLTEEELSAAYLYLISYPPRP
jgi:mono/diheme cytochrome c family protein